MHGRPWLTVVVVPLVLASCAGPSSSDETIDVGASTTSRPAATTTVDSAPTGIPVIIDSDLGVEGIMSIVYLLGQETLDVRAITVSGTGLVHCEAGIAQVLGILELVDAGAIPVACGSEKPLHGSNAFPTSWRVSADEAYGWELPQGGTSSEMSAAELIVSSIEDSPVPIVLYADGPQTNLAEALRLEQSIADNVEMAYVMGGALDTWGNSNRNPAAEWNIWVDPWAADEVFRALPVTLVPLDATNQVPLHIFHLETLQEHQDTAAAKAVVEMLEGNEGTSAGGLYFWDQLTAAILVDPAYADFATMNVDVVLDDDRSVAGATVSSPSGSRMRVATEVDTARFETDFLSAIAGADTGPIIVDADWMVSFDGTEWFFELPERATSGSYTIQLTNDGDSQTLLAYGWLTDEGNLEDARAWTNLAKPPFLKLASTVYVPPHVMTISRIDLKNSQTYAVYGLNLTGEIATMLGAIEVTD